MTSFLTNPFLTNHWNPFSEIWRREQRLDAEADYSLSGRQLHVRSILRSHGIGKFVPHIRHVWQKDIKMWQMALFPNILKLHLLVLISLVQHIRHVWRKDIKMLQMVLFPSVSKLQRVLGQNYKISILIHTFSTKISQKIAQDVHFCIYHVLMVHYYNLDHNPIVV